jgi:hypothetical protein
MISNVAVETAAAGNLKPSRKKSVKRTMESSPQSRRWAG